MLGAEVRVQKRRLEVHERLDLPEEGLRPCPSLAVEDRKDKSLELRALLVICLDPVATLQRKRGRIERMERVEERANAFGIFVSERVATDQAVADIERISRDVLESGHLDRKCQGEPRQKFDLEPEHLFDTCTARKAEHP